MAETCSRAPRTAGERSLATALRMRLHRAVADDDLHTLWDVLDQLYHDSASPLLTDGSVAHTRGYAPVVECTIAARLLRPGTAVETEMALSFENTRAQFGVSDDDYEAILRQLDTLSDVESDQWCRGTCMESLVKPGRFARFFRDAA